MKILFDTSVLIASFIKSHSSHELALKWYKKVINNKVKLYVSAHSIAETYSVLTKYPTSPRIRPNDAKRLINDNIKPHAKIISLSANDYMALISDLVDLDLTGGVVFDAIIYQAARKAKVNKILTLNVKDFSRLCLDHKKFIIAP